MTVHWRLPILVSLLAMLIAVLAGTAVYGQASCVETITDDGVIAGEWTTSCSSAVEGRGYARYYSFELTESSVVAITLYSNDADTYLYLREGGRSGEILYGNDDDGSTSRSSIAATLPVGTYTIEATTYSAGETGEFGLAVYGIAEGDSDDIRLVIAPGPGHIHHKTGEGASDLIAFNLYDVYAGAIFRNPYGGDEHDFSYGFILRYSGADSPYVRFYVHSDGWWRLSSGDIVYQGTSSDITDSEGNSNHLSITIVGKYAVLRVNGQLLQGSNGEEEFDIGPGTARGTVWISNGVVEGSARTGDITRYYGPFVYEVFADQRIDDIEEAGLFADRVSRLSELEDFQSAGDQTIDFEPINH